MSVKARVRLCSGLAKIGWLSRRKWQSIFPTATRITVKELTTSIRVESTGLDVEIVEYKRPAIACNIKAGENIVVSSINSTRSYDSSRFSFKIDATKGESMTVDGKCGGIGQTDNGVYKDFETAVFIVPLSGGYYYTEAMRTAFGLSAKNENIGTYPNCRKWGKD